MSKQRRGSKALKRFQRLKKRLMKESDGKCFYCKVEMVPGIGAVNDSDNTMTVDHLLPRADGGAMTN
jgi:5-methylcytosine-specific restriction endonuclease McrA